jgi:hypothetical protein
MLPSVHFTTLHVAVVGTNDLLFAVSISFHLHLPTSQHVMYRHPLSGYRPGAIISNRLSGQQTLLCVTHLYYATCVTTHICCCQPEVVEMAELHRLPRHAQRSGCRSHSLDRRAYVAGRA